MKSPLQQLLLLALCATLLACAKPSPVSVSDGRVEAFPQMGGKYLSARNVTVWIPDAYDRGDTCDVLYMHDGQMLFDSTSTWNHQEWQVDEVAGRLIKEGKMRPTIIVGIDNDDSERLNDYYPQRVVEYVDSALREQINPNRFHADAYLRFIVEELKPMIDSRYRVHTDAAHTFIMGSSMGGLISLYALCEYPNVFGGAACMSTHLPLMLPNALGNPQFDHEPVAEAFRAYVANTLPTNSKLLYMDRGTETVDTNYVAYQDAFDQMMKNRQWDTAHYRSLVFNGHAHDEISWARRLDQPFLFLLAK